jgi:Alginate lyase
VLAVLGFVAGGPAAGVGARVGAPEPSKGPEIDLSGDRYYLSAAEIAEMRENVASEPWARVAWRKTLAWANRALGATPHPGDPTKDYFSQNKDCKASSAGWYCGLFEPGSVDGENARNLALAYVVSGDRRYAEKAKEFLLAWERSYHRPPPQAHIGHMVAEPVGFMIKGFMAYDLIQNVFTPAESEEFREWAWQFVVRGEANADFARDHPWIEEAPYGNSATWQRAMAVWAAAVAGKEQLVPALAWNWSHRTASGRDYGWSTLLDGAMARSGMMVEERVRQSVDYALFTWHPLALIADVAHHAGYPKNLFTVRTTSGKSLELAAGYYVPYLGGKKSDPYNDPIDWKQTISGYRTVFELAAKRMPDSHAIRSLVISRHGKVRGSDYDPFIVGYNALTGG